MSSGKPGLVKGLLGFYYTVTEEFLKHADAAMLEQELRQRLFVELNQYLSDGRAYQVKYKGIRKNDSSMFAGKPIHGYLAEALLFLVNPSEAKPGEVVITEAIPVEFSSRGLVTQYDGQYWERLDYGWLLVP